VHTVDWVVIGLYGAIVLSVGLLTGRGRHTREDMFLGSRRIPAWAAFGSMIATEISAATFVAVPAMGFGHRNDNGWWYLQFGLGSLCARIFLVYFFLRVFYDLGVVTVYQFLRSRFGRSVEVAAAWLFLGGRLLASGVRLFIASLAFATVTGYSIEVSIVASGGIASLYTLVGGIRAVIWTDVIQGSVFVIAAVATMIVLGISIEGGWSEILSAASFEGKTQIFHFPELTSGGTSVVDGLKSVFGQSHPLWIALLGGFFLTLATHGTDQDMVQRLLTTRDSSGGGAALIGSGIAAIPVAAVFLIIGTGLWYFYSPEGPFVVGSYAIEDRDRIFPIFILEEMPIGLRGLIFAGLFAAAMSSLDSALNSLATTWTIDVRHADTASVSEIRFATVVFAVLLIGAALGCVRYKAILDGTSMSLVGIALASMTVLYGGLLGAFLVGLLTSRGSTASMLTGMLVASLVGVMLLLQPVYLGGETVIAWPWWTIIGAVVSFAIGVGRTGNEPEPSPR